MKFNSYIQKIFITIGVLCAATGAWAYSLADKYLPFSRSAIKPDQKTKISRPTSLFRQGTYLATQALSDIFSVPNSLKRSRPSKDNKNPTRTQRIDPAKIQQEIKNLCAQGVDILADGEVVHLRTRFAKTYYKGNDNFQMVASRVPLHYKTAQGKWEDVDMDLADGEMNQGNYVAKLLEGEIGYTIRHEEDDKWITTKLQRIGNARPSYRAPTINKNTAIWEEIVPGVDLIIRFHNDRVRVWRRLKRPQAPFDIVWHVEEDEPLELNESQENFQKDDKVKLKVLETAPGYDANGVPTYTRRLKSDEEKREGKVVYNITDTFTGEVIVMDMVTRRKSLSSDVQYPVMIDGDVNIPVALDGDDGFARYSISSTGGVPTTTKLIFKTTWATNSVYYSRPTSKPYSFAESRIFTRFTGITIPQGAVINSAVVKMYSHPDTNNPLITIEAKKLNNPTAPTAYSQVFTTGTLASATVTKQLASTTQQYIDFDVAAIVQELVNTFDYSNEAMLFFFRTLPNTLYLTAYFYDLGQGDPAKFPRLVVNYTISAGVVWQGCS